MAPEVDGVRYAPTTGSFTSSVDDMNRLDQ